MALTPGGIVGGKYRVERILGEGGMGIVVAATHLQLGQTVALKCMRPEVVSPSYTKRFMREARASVKLKSQHAARVLDVGAFEDGTPYIVMEHLEGRDLSDLLKIRGRLPVPEAVEYILQACEAIGEAHAAGIVHRDLKPQNVLLARTYAGRTIKVLDFGISKILEGEAPSETTTQATVGTPRFMAPEQIKGQRDIDTRADVWALGVLAYYLLSRKYPFDGDSIGTLAVAIVMNDPKPLRERAPDVPEPLAAAVMSALCKDRERRTPGPAAQLFVGQRTQCFSLLRCCTRFPRRRML